MPKKVSAKRKTKRRSGAGTKLRIKKDPKLAKRLAELDLSTAVLDQDALALFLEMRRAYPMSLEFARTYDAAIQAWKEAAYVSSDPKEWLRTARRTAGLR
jgi:hypothetical protein